jgi:hypothetical protein
MRGYSFFGCQQFSIFIFASDGSLWGATPVAESHVNLALRKRIFTNGFYYH